MNYTIILHAEVYETESWDRVGKSPLSFEVKAPDSETAVKNLQESLLHDIVCGVKISDD